MTNLHYFLTILSFSATWVMTGFFLAFIWIMRKLEADLAESKIEISKRVEQFEDITKRASELNRNHAEKLIEMDTKLRDFGSRLDMLDNTIKMAPKSPTPWRK